MGESSKLWSEGPQICNVDPKVMPLFSFHAKCNFCGESIPFTSEVERDMRKHYNSKHRLYCKACKKSDFNSRENLDIHMSTVHKDGICFNCHASFKLASALAMHVEGPKNECAVPQTALANALRDVFQEIHNGVPDPNSVYSPISCSSGSANIVQKLREFRKTLLAAHEKAFLETRKGQPSVLPVDQGATEIKLGNAACENIESSTPSSTATGDEGSSESPEVKPMISQISNRNDTHPRTAVLRTEWTCSTCVDAKFTTLSKLLQHVEQKVRNSWWMSVQHEALI